MSRGRFVEVRRRKGKAIYQGRERKVSLIKVDFQVLLHAYAIVVLYTSTLMGEKIDRLREREANRQTYIHADRQTDR